MPNTSPATFVYRLPHYGLLSVSSADNLKFLQGQVTCDVREVSAEQWRYGALCTNKGRMISNFLLAQLSPQQHVLRLHRSTLESVQDTLKKFAPFYKGVLADVTADYVLLGIAGKDSESLVQSVFSVPSSWINTVATSELGCVIKLDQERYECWVKADKADTCWDKLISSVASLSEQDWDLLNIRAGLGEVRQETIEAWTPHMLNLQVVGAVNFKKGCYTGQEIVARTEYRGQQKRAMYRVQGQGMIPKPGTTIMDGEHSAGEIVMASSCGDRHWEALAVIGDSHLENPLFCQQESIQLLNLPYSLHRKKSAS